MKRCVWIVMLLCLACTRHSDLSGRYEASHNGLSGGVDVIMILAEDGGGKWEIGGEVVPFLWSARSGSLFVHTREGGIVEGRPEGGDVRMDVPGVGLLLFVRQK